MTKYKLSLEVIPGWALSIIFAIFFVFFGLFVIFGVKGPNQYSSTTRSDPINEETWKQFLNGELSLQGSQTGLKPLNTELYFWLLFSSRAQNYPQFGFSENLKINVTIYTFELNPNTQITEPKFLSNGGTHIRKLHCRQKGDSVISTVQCNPMVVFHLPTLATANYILKFTILPSESHKKGFHNLLDRKLVIGMTYVNEFYSFFEIIFRYGFLVLGLSFLFAFSVITICKQPSLKEWHTEQKWILLLLVSLIFFNNPLFILHYYLNSWFWPLINIIFRTTYICILLISLLVFTHAVYKTQSERKFFSFYLPKIGVVGSLWVLICLTLAWNSYENHLDPVYNANEELQFFKYIMYMSYTLIGIYVCMLGYYIIRGVLLARELPKKFSLKLKVVWGMTIVVVSVVFIVIVVLSLIKQMKIAVIFIIYQVVFNIYTYILAFLFLPSTARETITDYELEKQGMLSGD